MLKMTGVNLFQALKCIWSLKKVWKKVFLTLLNDTVKPILNTQNRLMIVSQVIYYVMSQYLPYNRFKRLKQKEIDGFHGNLVGENGTCDYLLELHRWDNDYSLVTKKLEISRDMLSKHCSDVADQYGIKVVGV